MIADVFLFVQVIYNGVCVCCEEEEEGEGEAVALEEESEEGGGWGVHEEEEAAEDVEALLAADVEVSIMLLWVMKRRRSFMAGRKVMMIFSTWTDVNTQTHRSRQIHKDQSNHIKNRIQVFLNLFIKEGQSKHGFLPSSFRWFVFNFKIKCILHTVSSPGQLFETYAQRTTLEPNRKSSFKLCFYSGGSFQPDELFYWTN